MINHYVQHSLIRPPQYVRATEEAVKLLCIWRPLTDRANDVTVDILTRHMFPHTRLMPAPANSEVIKLAMVDV